MRTKVIGISLLGVILALLIKMTRINFVNRSSYRIADDGNCEILYIKNNVAIKRQFFPANPLEPESNIYFLCKAHYMGSPDYRFQTGDITDRIILENILSINANEDGNVITGIFIRDKKNLKSKAFFVFTSNSINTFDKENEFKSFLHDKNVLLVNFLSPREFIDKHK